MPAASKKRAVRKAGGLPPKTGGLRSVGGSVSDAFNHTLADQVVRSLWLANTQEDERERLHMAALATLISIAPKDELEGMLAGQMVAAHAASMECYRRAMLSEQGHEARQSNLNHAGKLSRTYVQLLEALNRHRGKTGQQKVTVEHVHVHAGGQAVVGSIEASLGGGGVIDTNQRQPHALTNASQPTLRSQGEDRTSMLRASDGERSLPDARGRLARRTEGQGEW